MKKILRAFTMLFTVVAFAQIPTNNLIARYDFSSGAILTDTSGNTANNHNLTGNSYSTQNSTFSVSNQTSDRFGRPNNALNMYSSFLYNTDMNFSGTNSNDFDITYSFWVKTSNNSSNMQTIFDDSTRGAATSSGFGASDFGYFIGLQNGFVQFSSRFYSTQQNQAKGFSFSSTINIADGNWHHVLVYFHSKKNSTLTMTTKIYIDGVVEVKTQGFNNINFSNSPNRSGQFTIANRATNPYARQTFNYADNIDDILIYDRELSLAEVNKIFKVRLPGKVYVNPVAAGKNDGSSWTDAYINLKDGLNNSIAGDSIWIAEGIYKPAVPITGFRNDSFNVNTSNLKIFGGFNGTETALSQRDFRTNKTILSGDLDGNDDTNIAYVNTTRTDNSFTVLYLGANANNILLDGITISDGHADNKNVDIRKRSAALGIDDAVYNLEINNCRFENNVAIEGGGISFWKYSHANTGYLKINNTVFLQNLAPYGATFYIYTNAANALNITVSNSLFAKNITKNTATEAGYHGSAGWFRANRSGSTLNTTFINNTYAFNEDRAERGGWNENSIALIGIGEATGANATIKLVNNIFFRNVTPLTRNRTNTTSTIITGRGNAAVSNEAEITLKSNSNDDSFRGLPAGTSVPASNKTEIPDFNFTTSGYYTLKTTSPMINTGDNSEVIGTKDLDGNMRILNTTVDRGAYESNSATASILHVNEINFSIFPNPSQGKINITTATEIKSIAIYNLLGKKVKTFKTKSINISSLSKGIYLLKLETENGKTGIQKIIKE